MTRQQWAITRFGIICAAWAAGETIGSALDVRGITRDLFGGLGAIGAFALTMDIGLGRGGGSGNVRYWRGRRIND